MVGKLMLSTSEMFQLILKAELLTILQIWGGAYIATPSNK